MARRLPSLALASCAGLSATTSCCARAWQSSTLANLPVERLMGRLCFVTLFMLANDRGWTVLGCLEKVRGRRAG
eukprot:CAMPEP_0179293764 /NCGR_PEP_ID=MMETSP0797-20121207/43543_1 /TAXON_ID=47934 /ORGANISM="Dinophysis acuminata, Strain DAEP01" /LENGTH=73 /DNA_ID=CAMNT_0021002925 /DNA_START=412 /DNA_END=633 /DNA_ORIENTATION=-